MKGGGRKQNTRILTFIIVHNFHLIMEIWTYFIDYVPSSWCQLLATKKMDFIHDTQPSTWSLRSSDDAFVTPATEFIYLLLDIYCPCTFPPLKICILFVCFKCNFFFLDASFPDRHLFHTKVGWRIMCSLYQNIFLFGKLKFIDDQERLLSHP